MFQSLSDKLQATLGDLRSRGALSAEDIDRAMREIRLALLEADVNFRVVKTFVAAVRERSVGQEVATSLTPGQQVVKIVDEELTELLGAAGTKLTFAAKPPTVILLCGLQGSGKTTAAGKLASLLAQAGPEARARGLRPAAPGRRRAAQDARHARSTCPSSSAAPAATPWPSRATASRRRPRRAATS